MAISSPSKPIYLKWPLYENNKNDNTNIVSIDLTTSPESIVEVRELDGMPKLKEAIYQLNYQNTAIMTLGCLFKHGFSEDGKNISYIDFCFRPEINTSRIDTATLDEQFLQHIRCTYSAEFANLLRHHLKWEVSNVLMDDNQTIQIYSVFLATQDPELLEHVYVPLIEWLHNNFLHLV